MTDSNSEADAGAPRPRIRSGAIAWGLIVCAVSLTVASTVSSADKREAFMGWLLGLGAGGLALIAVLALGSFILLLSALSLIRRAQRRRRA